MVGRVLTTHTGSLPRPPELLERPDGPALEAAVHEIVRRQSEVGLDIVNDGEFSKPNFSTYVTDRLTGFGSVAVVRAPSVESTQFPEFYASPLGPEQVRGSIHVMTCVEPIAWRGDKQVARDIANLTATGAEDVFVSAASPGLVWYHQPNAYYATHEEYVWAAAEALKHEYDALHGAGFIVQLDCPDLAGGWNRPEYADASVEEFRALVRLHVEALDHATRDIPPERLRMHVCWGNTEAPHVRDIALADILDIVLTARPAALSLEGSNPRHAHEWQVLADTKLPDEKILIVGALDSTTNFVEHPELVAQRILRHAEIVGRERVIAGADCGFATLGPTARVHPTVAWAKLGALVEGAQIASHLLWR